MGHWLLFWMGEVEIYFDKPSLTCTSVASTSMCTQSTSAATNYPTPQGCSPTKGSPLCSGWITEAVFPPTTFTSTDCGTSCHVEAVFAGQSGIVGPVFDELCTHAWFSPTDLATGVSCTLGPNDIPPVSPGDTLVVTIAFSIS